MQDSDDMGDNRPKTPESPLANSLYHASATIDDLTTALENFSRVPSPEPPFQITCCCGKEDCESTKAWSTFKSGLEERLVLSAEVGQALLRKHEAYIRKHEGCHIRRRLQKDNSADSADDPPTTHEHHDALIDELEKEKTELEKRLKQSLVNNEVAEVSNQTVLHELREARATISRLTAQHARSIGWDTRLAAVMQERDDMQQERDAEAHRSKQAEGRISALKSRTAKLEGEVQRLQRDLEERRLHRLESSECVLQDARARLEALQASQLGRTALAEETELIKVLESLVEDNEGLKRDNAELQHLLTEAREDYHSLQEEMEEQRANNPSHANTPHLKSLFLTAGAVTSPTRRDLSADSRNHRSFQPPNFDNDRYALSPLHSRSSSETKWTSPDHPQSNEPASRPNYGVDGPLAVIPPSPEKAQPHKPLFLLSRDRGVQTEPLLELSPYPTPLPVSTPPPHDPRSESSSLTDSPASSISILVERMAALLQRMAQADALTLTNRLKRQNLKGADIAHLSRTTVGGIISDIGNIRAQFRVFLEDDKVTTICTRKDLRGLFKLFKETFSEMGQIRITLNDVILDPSSTSKLSEMALNPSKGSHSATAGWIAPITKFFAPSAGEGTSANQDGPPPSQTERRGRAASRPRIAPKLGPALSASTTTVNVEFSGSGVGRAVTSTLKARDGDINNALMTAASHGAYHTSTNVMGIFAGAPRNESWVILPPKTSLESPSDALSPSSPSKSSRGAGKRLSKHVDAVIDASSPKGDEDSDYVAPLLQRTLRRRGLSDSSIHTTFISQAVDGARGLPHDDVTDRSSVLRALSKTVKSFGLTTPSALEIQAAAGAGGVPGQRMDAQGNATDSALGKFSKHSRMSSQLGGLLPHFPSWTGQPFHVGSIPTESSVVPPRSHGGHGRDHF